VAALVEVLAEGARLGLEPGDAQLLARYERWRAPIPSWLRRRPTC
jgi:2-octaprenyl-6-methoxyphenol hydroxylase